MISFNIAVLPGDGIGTEIVPPTVDLINDAATKVGGFKIDPVFIEAGAALYARTGVSFPEESFEISKKADAILLGAMGLPSVRNPDGREIAPQLAFRPDCRSGSEGQGKGFRHGCDGPHAEVCDSA